MRRVLVLRPEPGASATVERARQRGLDAVAVPLFEVKPVAWEVPDPGAFDALLLTSANAVRHGGPGLAALRGLPVYAVGEATAEAARTAGFMIAATGDAGVERLLGSIDPDLKLLHLAGEERTETAGKLTSVTVYRAREIERPDLSAAAGAAVLIHSPRAGRRLAELVGVRDAVAIVAISAAAAEAVGSGWEIVESAPQPTDEALLALAARLCNNPPER
jgi:uroporphyrinogen-III synthase